jgi:hypothetical protein
VQGALDKVRISLRCRLASQPVAAFDFLDEFSGDHEGDAPFAGIRPAPLVLVAVVGRLGEEPAIGALFDGPHVEGVDILCVRKHPPLLYDPGEDGGALDGVRAAGLTPAAILVGFDLDRVIAALVHADAGRDTVGKHRFEQFLQRVLALDFKELVELCHVILRTIGAREVGRRRMRGRGCVNYTPG